MTDQVCNAESLYTRDYKYTNYLSSVLETKVWVVSVWSCASAAVAAILRVKLSIRSRLTMRIARVSACEIASLATGTQIQILAIRPHVAIKILRLRGTSVSKVGVRCMSRIVFLVHRLREGARRRDKSDISPFGHRASNLLGDSITKWLLVHIIALKGKDKMSYSIKYKANR